MQMDISVIVCTYNRCENLKMLVNSLEGLKDVQTISWELIVVDNNSNDRTKAFVDDLIKAGHIRIKYIFEGRQGKSFALNAGIKSAEGEIIAFLDDDGIVTPLWLACLVKEFRKDPTCAGIGGRVELYDPRDKPITIRTLKEEIYLSSSEQLFCLIPGCNMAFIRRVFQEVGNFDVRFGPGATIPSAEDSDFIYRVYKNGFRILYSPNVVIYHNHGRRTDSQVDILTKEYIAGRGSFYCKHILEGDFETLKMAYWEIAALIRTLSNNPRDRALRCKSVEHMQGLLAGSRLYLKARLGSFKNNIWQCLARKIFPMPLQRDH